jgi:hypothetical protein
MESGRNLSTFQRYLLPSSSQWPPWWSTRLHGGTSQQTIVFRPAAKRTWNVTQRIARVKRKHLYFFSPTPFNFGTWFTCYCRDIEKEICSYRGRYTLTLQLVQWSLFIIFRVPSRFRFSLDKASEANLCVAKCRECRYKARVIVSSLSSERYQTILCNRLSERGTYWMLFI